MANTPENSKMCLHSGKCDYFSIRKYVSDERQKNWRRNWPFQLDECGEISKEDILSKLPPMELPKLNCWKCHKCLSEMNPVEKPNVDVDPMGRSNDLFTCNAETKKIEAADIAINGRAYNIRQLNQRSNESIRPSSDTLPLTENLSGKHTGLQDSPVSEHEGGTTVALEDPSIRKVTRQTIKRQSPKDNECIPRKKANNKARRNIEETRKHQGLIPMK